MGYEQMKANQVSTMVCCSEIQMSGNSTYQLPISLDCGLLSDFMSLSCLEVHIFK